MKQFLFYIVSLILTFDSLLAQDYNAIINSLSTDKQKADTVFSFARKNFRKGRFDSVAHWLNYGQHYADKSANPETIARYYVEKGNLNYMTGKFKDGVQEIKKAVPFLENTDSYDLHNSSFLITGNCFAGLQQNDSALYYFKKCEDYNNSKFPYRNWLVYSAIADLYRQSDDNKNAQTYFQKAYNLTTGQEGKPDHGYVLTQFANFYLVTNNAENFGKLLAEYNDLMAERKRKTGAEPAHNLLFLSWTTTKTEDKVKFMKEVIELALKSNFYDQALLANDYIISFYEKNKQYEDAIRYVSENETIALKTGNPYNEYTNAKLKYNLLKKAGKMNEAALAADRLFVLKDSILSIQRREQMYDMEAKYETEKKQKEIELLASQKELGDKNIALLTTDKQLAAALVRQQQLQNKSLQLENFLMDSIVKSEKAYSIILASENEFKADKLQKEKELMQSLTRENISQAKQVKKERQNKTVWAIGAGLLLLSGISILALYRRQRKKSLIIQKQAADLEVLMKEIHHRVKNNLQVISSLLDLQSMTIADSQASEAVMEGRNRVQSMALIHQNLYSEGNIKGIRAKEYINNLLQSLCNSYNTTNDKVEIKTQIDDLNLDVDTMIPLGLVLNELVSNSLKYAFKDGRQGELSIVLKEEANHLLLKVSDNGAGYPEGMNAKDGKSFGMKMIKAFAQKLKAKLEIYNNNGAVVEMQITKYNLA